MYFALVVVAIVALLVVGCAPLLHGIEYKDTTTPDGLVNFHLFAPGMIRVAHPTTMDQWRALDTRMRAEPATSTLPPLFVQLHFDYEGDDSSFTQALGWELLKVPLYPEDGKPWTVAMSSPPSEVMLAVNAIVAAKRAGRRVAWGCIADRDRGGVVSGLVAMILFDWSEEKALRYMGDTGSRIELLPGLLVSFLQSAPKA